MIRSPFSTSHRQGIHAGKAMPAARDALDFLRAHDRLATLMPTVTRMAALQKDCAALLPEMFNACEVLQFESEQLVFAVPNAALAARLKQNLPKLQESLAKRGWQVSAIRLKVQVAKNVEKTIYTKQLVLPDGAVTAMASLGTALEDAPRNAALKAAIDSLVRRHRGVATAA
jgi:hypothetical protein